MKNPFLVLPFIILTACGSNDNQQELIAENITEGLDTAAIADSVISIAAPTNLEKMAEDGALFQFHGFQLLVDTLEVWSESRLFDCQDSDTTWVSLGLGYGIADRTIQFYGEQLTDFSIQQSYETSVTVMNEGPHCDLYNWKHYQSDWKDLALNESKIQTLKYQEKEWEVFIPVEMDELIEEVRKNCGDEWAEHASQATSPTDYPCGVSVSAIYLKIQYTRPGFDALTTKYLAFDVPMGC